VRSPAETDIFDYKTSIISVIELVLLVSALLAICGLRVPTPLRWSGFAANLLLSLFALIYAFLPSFPAAATCKRRRFGGAILPVT
jgi:hypothetical protein